MTFLARVLLAQGKETLDAHKAFRQPAIGFAETQNMIVLPGFIDACQIAIYIRDVKAPICG
jgi:hypothetical protein